MVQHGVEALYSAMESMMHAIRTDDDKAHKDVAHQMIQIAKLWTIRRLSELNPANGRRLVRMPKENAHLTDPEWTEDEQPNLQPLLESYTSRGASGA